MRAPSNFHLSLLASGNCSYGGGAQQGCKLFVTFLLTTLCTFFVLFPFMFLDHPYQRACRGEGGYSPSTAAFDFRRKADVRATILSPSRLHFCLLCLPGFSILVLVVICTANLSKNLMLSQLLKLMLTLYFLFCTSLGLTTAWLRTTTLREARSCIWFLLFVEAAKLLTIIPTTPSSDFTNLNNSTYQLNLPTQPTPLSRPAHPNG